MFFQFGDFVAIATLTTKAIQAVSSSRGSKSEFDSLVKTLEALRQAALQADTLGLTSPFDAAPKDKGLVMFLNSVATAITKERKECEALIDKFLGDFAAYVNTFMGARTCRMYQGARSLTWMVHKNEIATLERLLNARLQALQLLLCRFYFASIKIDMADHTECLRSIDSSVGGLNTEFKVMQRTMSEAMSEQLTKLDLVQKSIPAAIGYCWGAEAPILLLDGLGRRTSLPIMLASSPDVFRDVLLIMHRDTPGYDKIESGKYVVSNEDANGTLISPDEWLDTFRPGRRISLSFLLKHPLSSDEKQCPRCKTLKTWPDVHPGQRKCLKCYLTFKVEDQEQTRLYWKDLKLRPKRQQSHSASSAHQKPRESPDNRPLTRNGTLPPHQYAHPSYQRVHYQRDSPRRMPTRQRWRKTDPKFKKFLAALPPLHRAAATGDISKLDVLLDSGESCDDVDWEVSDSLYRHDQTGWDFTGAPPVHFAAYYGHTQAVLFLLTKGAAIDAKDAAGTTALHAAAWTGNEELFQNLLRKGADSSICDYDGWSVTVYAMSQGHVSILRLLLENSDGDAEMPVKRSKVRHAAKLGHQDNVLAMLLEDQATGEDEKAREMLFAEALAGAADGGHVELVQKLLDRDADPTAPDSSGSTALHWAVWGGHAEAGNMMRDEKNSVEKKNGTAEMGTHSQLSLTSRCHESVIQLLLEKGATIDAQNRQGSTPLHWVSGAGSAQMIQCLLDHDADVTVVDKSGRTAIDRAVGTRDALVVEQLQSELRPIFSPSTEHFANEVGTQQKGWYF